MMPLWTRQRRTLLIGGLIAAAVTIVLYAIGWPPDGVAESQRTPPELPFQGGRSYEHLRQICALGPRVSGTEGMRRQQQLLSEHFTQLGGNVVRQEFAVRHPLDGSELTLTNLIVEWHPQRRERILLCCHYDTRPFPDRDRRNPRGRFVGANDGASGVALLMELGRLMKQLDGPLGVDFVFFDAEELIFDDRRDEYFLGSTHFARLYSAQPPPHCYRAGVLLDMVADAHLDLYYERQSLRHARTVAESIWRTAARLGVREFVPRSRHDVRDDHLPLNEIAGIPTCDVIDFDYPMLGRHQYWHTEADTPDKCSAQSLAKVGWVLWEWLRETQRDPAAIGPPPVP